MAIVRTVDFLPEIFQTPVNRQFLSATLDQLVQEPQFKKTQGYVGRKVGPGVAAADRYVVEPTKSRNEYQLEPGVIEINPANSQEILDAITYPGITDALKLQGADTSKADRLYTSEYYAFDPFIDFDKFTNFAQYYWLPQGPLAVDVSATKIPLTDDFTVTRANGVYTFSGVAGNNPVLTLVRGGNYNFNVAQNATETVNFRVSNNGAANYIIDYEPNPTLTLVRGNTYIFSLSLTGIYPFYIKTVASLGNINTYDNGVLRNGASTGSITFTVPQDAPDTLYYCNSLEFNMRGQINVVDGTAGTGPGFWIQTDPGVNGRLPYAPNISSRDILGVFNNGEDLGTVQFNVPLNDAQSFYYSLTNIGTVDLITNLQFNQINNQPVESFNTTYGGIDGITSLNGRTLVFQETNAGWEINVIGGGFGDGFDSGIPIDDPALRYSIWQIDYVTIDGTEYIQLNSVLPVSNLEKFQVLFGAEYSSTSWYKNAEEYFQEIPLLTAIKDVLYYQDGTDPLLFGQIRLINPENNASIDISSIVDHPNYTSPNGVVFTNGMKVVFRGNVNPASYENNEYYVEGVGTAIKLLPIGNFITPETYTQSATVPYDSTPYDVGNFDATLNAPLIPDYLTINRASPDLNAWSRSNRWFHIDVINVSAEYNNTIAVVDNLQRASRPILEFRAGTRLFNFGTDGVAPVDIIDFSSKDALSNINGTIGYSTDGYTFVNGTTVIFAADIDPNVRNQVYQVQFITPDTVPPLIAEPVINLTPIYSIPIQVDQTTVCLSGNTLQGISFYFDGVDWLPAQEKTKTNQAPLFDVYDSSGISFSYRPKYPSSTFTGSKLFSYATPTTATDTEIYSALNDPILGFQLVYLSLSNVGDIVFDNNLYKDTFVYAPQSVGTTVNISTGFVREYTNRTTFKREIGWQTGATKTRARQQFQFSYDGKPLLLDVKVNPDVVVPAIQLYVNATFQESYNYRVITSDTTTTITLLTAYTPGDVIEVDVLSDQASAVAFYQVPANLENNPLNSNSNSFTLGTIRNHYNSICQNLINIQGPINGANNSRDLGNIIPYGQQILQQSAPLTLAGYFMRSKEYDIFGALDYNSREYIKFKSKLLEAVISNDYGTMTISQILDAAIAEITQGRSDINPFYWSDMLPTGPVFQTTNTTVTAITTATFNTIQTYNFTYSNYLGLLVYIYPAASPDTPILLERGYDYIVNPESPKLTITVPLNIGDVVSICEYNDTAGNFVPNTPTKLGLYPKFKPEIFYDTNYVNPVPVIQGHDGSITVAFGDYRDQVLLEFETRIFNNLKNDGNPIPLTVDEVMPGFFRTTDYTQAEITNILGESFLSWVGWNKLDYKTQDYITGNPFTYNYSSAGSKLDPATDQVSNINEQQLLGAWRGIYRYFYDTESPNYTPWEMLGFSEEPIWWVGRYGPAPYTSDNLVLWDDLANGFVADPIAPYIKPNYRRPGLQNAIPVGTEGQLLAPFESVMGAYDPTALRKSWQVGDGGPVEAAWWTSSSYPFAVMRLLSLTRPAEFFALFADRDDYRYNAELSQYLYNGRYRLDATGISIYGNGVSKASYIDWIVDYNQQLGLNSTDSLTTALSNLDVRLCYRMASFTDKQYLQIYTERSSPNSLNTSLLLPPESYNLLLYKNQPFADITYSALIVERVENGYAVFGYSTIMPYFQILVSSSSGIQQTVSAGGATVKVPVQYTNNVAQIPYGYTFTNITMVVDFILSYGEYLKTQGLIFNDQENGYTLDWNQMAREFLYFSEQGWDTGTLINLNPVATTLEAYRPGAIVDTIVSLTPENMLLNQNRGALPTRDLIVVRDGNNFSVSSTTTQTISFVQLRFTSYENMVVLDNRSIFNDLLYDPTTAARQSRIKIVASTTTNWNGELDAQGFILNDPTTVQQWKPYVKYTKGEIVIYKNQYWQAANTVQPAENFDTNSWYKSNYQLIQQGLLPNIANKADQLANSYNTQTANLERDNDLLAYGLIGFRPRQYMAALNLDDTTQVQLYQQFLGSKGTILSAELFTRADLGKETGDYNIYENWAVLAGTYGANANRSFYELQLNEAYLQADPSTIQVIQPGESSQANQTVFLDNVWRESYKLTSTDILPTTYANFSDTALPSAGYVDLDDVDITVYSLDDPSSIAANISKIGIGTTIWVAKVNSYNWGVYRCAEDPGTVFQVQDNLNGTAIAYFTAPHGLAIGDLIIIRYFGSVDGVYRVLGTPSVTAITIAFSFVNTNQTTITGNGLVFFLESKRVSQASDVANLDYAKSLLPGATVWVDNNGNGHWEVLRKEEPFSAFEILVPVPPVNNLRYGVSVSQSGNHFAAIVGMPGTGAEAGSVHTYRRAEDTSYVDNIQLTLNATDVVSYGFSTDFGGQAWAVVGAPGSNNNAGYVNTLYLLPASNNYEQTQLLVAPDQDFNPSKFGYAVTISQDERWMYIGAPGKNKVYAYGRVTVEAQQAVYTGDGVTTSFNYDSIVQIDPAYPDQLIVTVSNLTAIYQTDYVLTSGNILFTRAPTAGQIVRITRRNAVQIDQQVYYGVTANSQTGTGVAATFTVTNTRGVYYPTLSNAGSGYNSGDVLTISYTQVCPSGSGANDLTITVNSVLAGGIINEFTPTGSGITNTATFQLNPFLYTANNIYAFTVVVDGIIQRPHLDYDFNNDSNDITYDVTFEPSALPAAGATISVIADTYWQYISTIPAPLAVEVDAQFGSALSTATDGRQVFIGAPYDDANGEEYTLAGAVYVFDRSVVAYQVTNTTQTTYAIPGSFTEPVSVLLNSRYLTNTAQYLNGDFTVSGSDIILSSSLALTIGDTLEIETNQFQLIQKITDDTPSNNSLFGFSVNVCHRNCSVYTGAPFDSTVLPQAGSVQRNLNQSRIYGVITSTIANPILTAGNTIRINNFEVAVPPGAEENIQGFVAAINAANIPNAVATLTSNIEFIGDGVTKVFLVGSIYSVATTYTTVVYVNNVLQTAGVDYTYNPATEQINFVTAPVIKTVITVVSGRMTISIKNINAGTPANLLTVLPGTNGTAFDNLGFEIYPWVQQILSPNPTDYAQFGSSVNINTNSNNLVVGAPYGTVIEPVIFDGGTTTFDAYSTRFNSPIVNSGVVYTYDQLPSANSSITNPGKFVFGQQVYNDTLRTGDLFGTSVNYTSGRLLVGAPGSDVNNSNVNYGQVSVFDNTTDAPAWTVIRYQQPQVDTNLLNSVYAYDRLLSKTTTYFDFINPLQGKILGAARRNIDYIGAVDPAQYNRGTIHNNGNSWANEHLGEIWWDTDTVRFIDPNQDDIVYASRRWGQIFPGSRVDIYQWIASSAPPVSYTGQGTPLSTVTYTVNTALNKQNIIETTYYFWVRGITTIETAVGKTLSTTGIASYIESPRTSGIPYIAALNSSTVAIYNAQSIISAQDTILHVGFDRQVEGGDSDIHQEYQFVADGRPDSFLNATLYRKLQDSFCGVNETGANVPDSTLSPAERYGVQFRPRQSMFADRFMALQNYLTRVNSVLAKYPITESCSFNLLNSSEPEPTSVIASATQCTINGTTLTVGGTVTGIFSVGMTITGSNTSGSVLYNTVITELGTGTGGAGTYTVNLTQTQTTAAMMGTLGYNKRVATLEELSYQNLAIVPIGYFYLVASDSGQQGRWTIYEVDNGLLPGERILNLTRIQNYDTKLYWSYINWYQPGYNSTIQPLAQVSNTSALDTLSLTDVPLGGSAKVTANSQGKFEIYLRTGVTPTNSWTRVGLQDGTISFNEELWNYALGNFGFDVEVFDSQYFDQEPVIETRKIIQAINEELLIDDLAIERNSALILMFNFIYSEFTAPEWLMKTSLIDVDHKIRALLPYQIYQQDNQTFVLDYIQEVKPYHVQIREFNLTYYGQDIYPGSLTDYDVPAYWNSTLAIPQYISPILLPYDHATTPVQSYTSDVASNAEIWTVEPWKQWFNNYLISIDSVTVSTNGQGYLTSPTVTFGTEWQADTHYALGQQIFYGINLYTVTTAGNTDANPPTFTTGSQTSGPAGDSGYVTLTYFGTPATGTANINSAGQVISIDYTPGHGYITTPWVTINGGSGTGAKASLIMTNGLVRSIKTTIKYDRCEYTSTVVEWQPNVTYTAGTLVRYVDTVWSANDTVNTTLFITADWTLVDANSLSGADRTMGYYLPTANEPGLSLPLLIDGISYPGVQVTGPGYDQDTGFDVGNFDINPFDNFSYDASGRQTYDYGILDTFYSSSYIDLYLGTRPTDINVDGGAYVDTYSSHAPQELIPGAEFDTLDMRVYTTPGADWVGGGHGFPTKVQNYIFDSMSPTYSFAFDVFPYPVEVLVINQTNSNSLNLGINYTIDWPAQTVTIISGANTGDIIQVQAFELGGGNQLYKNTYNGADIGNSVIIPITYSLINEIAVFVNGVVTTEFTYSAFGTISTQIDFTNTYTITDSITLVAIGATDVNSVAVDYSWSTPQTQIIAGETGVLEYTLTNSLEYTNPDNIYVTVNGARARTSAGIEWFGDGSTEYLLPNRLGFSLATVADNEVHVYVNNIPQVLNIDFIVGPYDAILDHRGVVFLTDPTVGEQILITVDTNTQCLVNGDQLVFNAAGGLIPSDGDTIAVTTWNDTRQQNILTQVFVGPITQGVTVAEAYDETDYDVGNITGDAGSFDYSTGITVSVNGLVLEHVVTDPSRLWVTLNGRRLLSGSGFTLVNNEIILTSGQLLNPSDIVMVTEFTESVVSEAMAFRIFQDMRGVQATYRITPSTTTTLAQPLAQTDDIIYVVNAGALSNPDVAANIWGVLTINGERIMYRERDTVTNTVSSLLRGTAGTAAASHDVGALVYDMGRGNLLPDQFQNYIVSNSTLADGSTITYTAVDINLGTAEDSTNLEEAVEVYVGGTLVTSGYTIDSDNPVSITFTTAPASGSEVTILVRRGVTWYAPGLDTPSNGVALQDTNTQAARFLRGL